MVMSQALLPEIQFNDLEFLDKTPIGMGGEATVYRALWKSRKQADILGSLRHRNIVQFYGIVTQPPNYCIVTEYAELGSLYDYLKNPANPDLDFDGLLTWAEDIARGVHYLHEEAPSRIIHRDLKSKNVVITADSICKLCDFGTSKEIHHTTKHSLRGTVGWMSPEVIKSEPATTSTDAWSYAVVLWEMLTRQIPFKNLDELTIMYQIAQRGIRLKIPSTCPPAFAKLLDECWQTEPRDRPTFADILTRIAFMREDETLIEETKRFFQLKHHWTPEIIEHVDNLKQLEKDIVHKEGYLTEWERRLTTREQNIEASRKYLRQFSHDVNAWSTLDVSMWLQKLNINMCDDLCLDELAATFLNNHINGERLLLLTELDLRRMGVKSVGHVRQLLTEINKLNLDNQRLINFPPLSSKSPSGTLTKTKKPAVRRMKLALLFGLIMREGESAMSHKWKVFTDVDGVDCDDPYEYIHDVTYLNPPAGPYKSVGKPFVCPIWLVGMPDNGEIQCVVNFTDVVKQPRNIKQAIAVDFNRCGRVTERVIELTIAPSKNVTPTYSRNSSSSRSDVGNTMQLQGAWSEKHFADAVHNYPSTPQKSSIWAEIASDLRKPKAVETMNRKRSMPTPSPQPVEGFGKAGPIFISADHTPQISYEETNDSGDSGESGVFVSRTRENQESKDPSVSESPRSTRNVQKEPTRNGKTHADVPAYRRTQSDGLTLEQEGNALRHTRELHIIPAPANPRRQSTLSPVTERAEAIAAIEKQADGITEARHMLEHGSNRSVCIHGGNQKWLWKNK